MTDLVKYNNGSRLPTVSREEWLTPFDSFFDDVFSHHFPMLNKEIGDEFFGKGSYPKVDVINHEDKVTIEAEIPGLTKEDISLNVEDGNLIISGGKKTQSNNETKNYIRKELKKSSFRRSFSLGDNLDSNSITANFKDGILIAEIKKVTPVKKEIKSIEIK